jgi:hypothetical protein
MIETIRHGVLDSPPARGMTACVEMTSVDRRNPFT